MTALAEGYDGLVVIDGNTKDHGSPMAAFAGCHASGIDDVPDSWDPGGGGAIDTPLRYAPSEYFAIRAPGPGSRVEEPPAPLTYPPGSARRAPSLRWTANGACSVR